MSRWLVRFGYDGAGFAGWARQPGLRTVEGVIRDAIPRTGIAPTADEARVAVASRTDRGVSARANALALTSALPPGAVLRALNGIAPDIFFTALVPVLEGFSPRSTTGRWYRYFEPAEGHQLERWQGAAARFRGEIDVRSFGRDLPIARPSIRRIESVRVRRSIRRWFIVDVRAPSFVWGMVRKIIAALRQVDAGSLSLSGLEAALRGQHRLTLPLAEPEGLVLWDVTYEAPWVREWTGPNRRQTQYLAAVVRAARRREIIGQSLVEEPAKGATARRSG